MQPDANMFIKETYSTIKEYYALIDHVIQSNADMSLKGTLLTILKYYTLYVIISCPLFYGLFAVVGIVYLVHKLSKGSRLGFEPKVLDVRNRKSGQQHGGAMKDVEIDDVGMDDEEQDDEERKDGEENDRNSQHEFELKKLKLLIEDANYEKQKQRSFEIKKLQMSIESTNSEKEKELIFELKKIRLNIENGEREKERTFELRKMELENQRLEMGKRLDNEKVAIELANSKVLLELKKLDGEGRSGRWTPSTTCGSDYEVVTNEQIV